MTHAYHYQMTNDATDIAGSSVPLSTGIKDQHHLHAEFGKTVKFTGGRTSAGW